MNVNRKIAAVATVLLAAVSLSACGTPTAKPLAQADATTAPVAGKAPTGDKASSCDIAREAILTGTPASITAAMKGLVADKAADATAREYARYYLGRDAKNKTMREADVGLIQMSCS